MILISTNRKIDAAGFPAHTHRIMGGVVTAKRRQQQHGDGEEKSEPRQASHAASGDRNELGKTLFISWMFSKLPEWRKKLLRTVGRAVPCPPLARNRTTARTE
jgi:hypothetical protein